MDYFIRYILITMIITGGSLFSKHAFSQQSFVQPFVQPIDGILLPSPIITETDDATALSINPANIGFLDSWSLVYGGSWLQNQNHLAGQGHGLFFAFPLGPLGFGISTEFMISPEAINDWQGLDNRMKLSLGMSFNPVRSLGIGLAYRTFIKYDAGKLKTLDLSLTVRPINHIALAFTFSNLTAPSVSYSSTITEDNITIPSHQEDAARHFTVGLTVRPFGNDRFALGSELSYIYGTRNIYHPATSIFEDKDTHRTDIMSFLSLMITDGITLRTRFGAEGLRNSAFENSYFVDASIIIDGVRFPFGLAVSPYFMVDPLNKFEGISGTIRLSGDEPASIPSILKPRQVVLVEIGKKKNSYEFAELMYRFELIEDDKSVDMVMFKPEPKSISLTQAQELRRRIGDLKQAGKTTICYFTEATSSAYIACAGADHIWLNPAGGIRLAGISWHAIYFKKLLDKLGVSADIIRIGEYKSAPEMFTKNKPSNSAWFAADRYIESLFNQLLGGLVKDRNFEDIETVKQIINDGPFVASKAIAANLVDKLVSADFIKDELRELANSEVFLDNTYMNKKLRHRTYLNSPAVAVLHINGDITSDKSTSVPMLGIETTGAKTLIKQIKKLKQNSDIHAVVLRINSPGGSAVASDLIWRELMSLRKIKPIVATMGSVAASGAYYIASAADIIYAEPTTLTGSIGVFYGKVDVSKLLSKIGITTAMYKRGAHADMESWTRPYTPQERKKLLEQIKEYYNLFLDRVVEGRGHGFTRKIVDKLGRGRIWSGSDAKQQLLVDKLGGYQEALNHARKLGFVSQGTKVFHVPKPKKGLLQSFSKLMGFTKKPSMQDMIFLTPEIRSIIISVFPFTISDHSTPQTRLPFSIIESF